jgi:hypothetical protein
MSLKTIKLRKSVRRPSADPVANAFAFTPVVGAMPGAVVTGAVTLVGYDIALPFLFTGGGALSLDGGVTYSSLGILPAGGGTFPIQATASASYSTEVKPRLDVGVIFAEWSITTGVAATPVTILGSKLVAWFDNTDTTTMFTDANSSPTIQVTEGGTVVRQRAKNNPAILRGAFNSGSVGPTWSAAAYFNGTRPGLNYSTTSMSLQADLPAGGFGDATWAHMQCFQMNSGAVFGTTFAITTNAGNNDASAADAAAWRTATGGSTTLTRNNVSTLVQLAPGTNVPNRIITSCDGTTQIAYKDVSAGTASFTSTDAAYQVAFGAAPRICSNGYAKATTTGGRTTFTEQHVLVCNAALTTNEVAALDAWAFNQQGSDPIILGVGPYAGFKSFATTGDMALSANTIELTSVVNLVIGDVLMIEPTTSYKTKGPGGIWPATGLASKAAIQALDPTGATGTYPARRVDNPGDPDDGKTLWSYQVTDKNAVDFGTYYWLPTFDADSASGYWNKANPLCARVKVSAINPTTKVVTVTNMDLSTFSCQAAVAGANVYVDVSPVLNSLAGVDGQSVVIPAGTYWMGGLWQLSGKKNWTISTSGGNVRFRKPKWHGTPMFLASSCQNLTMGAELSVGVYDITFEGNHGGKLGGTGLDLSYAGANGWVASMQGVDFTIDGCTGANINVAFKDNGQACTFRNNSTGLLHTHVDYTQEQLCYIQWQIMATNCSFGGDVTFYVSCTSAYAVPMLNAFGCVPDKANGIDRIRFYPRNFINGMIACNSSDHVEILDIGATITANCIDETLNSNPPDYAIAHFMPASSVVNINSNAANTNSIGGPTRGVLVTIDHIIVEGYINSAGAVPVLVSMPSSVNSVCRAADPTPYNPLVPDDGNRKGLLRAPYPKAGFTSGWATGSNRLLLNCASQALVTGNADNQLWQNLRLQSFSLTGADTSKASERPAIWMPGIATNMRAVNCIADTVTAQPGNSGNITNAAYAAL